uniref:HMG box domain-containing protein n=1 Tax=Bursaphelenchus xylophilus TaxID=6326 RepID=A0A1I7S1Z0_BURXY
MARPTEIPECDVFVLDHKVSGDPRDQENYMKYASHKVFRRIKPSSCLSSVSRRLEWSFGVFAERCRSISQPAAQPVQLEKTRNAPCAGGRPVLLSLGGEKRAETRPFPPSIKPRSVPAACLPSRCAERRGEFVGSVGASSSSPSCRPCLPAFLAPFSSSSFLSSSPPVPAPPAANGIRSSPPPPRLRHAEPSGAVRPSQRLHRPARSAHSEPAFLAGRRARGNDGGDAGDSTRNSHVFLIENLLIVLCISRSPEEFQLQKRLRRILKNPPSPLGFAPKAAAARPFSPLSKNHVLAVRNDQNLSLFLPTLTCPVASSQPQYPLSAAVPDDEVFYFKNPVTMERELSSEVAKTDNALPIDHHDLENEDRHVTEQLESSPVLKDIAWLANQPKLNAKSKSGYILFSAEIRKRIMNENPESGFGEVSKIVGVEWKKLTDEQKRQYEERANIIADARAKNDLLTPNSKVLQPGEIRVNVCKWHGCDYQFDHPDGLFEHIRVSHASADENKVVIDGEAHYACLWMTCVKYRQTGKPFPSLPRLLRHIREKHMPASGKVIQPNQRGKHFFHYIPQSEPSNNSTKDQSHGLFINQPNGVTTATAVAHKTAIPLDGPPTTPSSSVPPYAATPSTSAAPPHSHQTQQTQQVYVQQTTPATTQVVQVINGSSLSINGSSVAYLNSSTPYQVIVNHQPQTIQAQPGQQIVVQHAVPSSSQQHIVVHGAQPQQLQPGQYQIHHGQVQQPQTSTYQNTVVTAAPKPEPLFVPPPNSIKVKRVLHSMTYYK